MTEITDYKKYLNPSVVARLSNMEFKARMVVEGFIAGMHKSPYHGFSVEFAEHRQYMPGDDLKHLDWKILGKTDRYYIKRYEEETNLKSYLLLDISRSMNFKSDNIGGIDSKRKGFLKKLLSGKESKPEQSHNSLTKLEYASHLAASLSYLMLLQRDAISLTTYDTKIRSYIPPHSTKANLQLILKELSNVESLNETGTAKCLNEIADKVKRRGLVIVFSDLFDEQNEVINALKHFRYDKNEVIIFQILDPIELTFLEGNPVTLKDMETNEEIFSQPVSMQKAYQESVQEFINKYKTECRKNNIDFITLSTSTPFDTALLNYLNKRKKLL
ncbi:MAG TPA: DUF58 domain-containing protein [Ignavibacteria bacterium]|nr:DUF58 domain-containing protein [Ignavibacteria bacterium]HMR39720.1 DUF58 domain-containing protein [Ignavibacteria bacterium]